MKVRAKIWIETDQGNLVLGEGRAEIFRAIERTGSLSAAARELNMSYRAVWGKVRTIEERLGIQLVVGNVGGIRHGGAKLTESAMRLVSLFEDFNCQAHQTIQTLSDRLSESVEAEIGKMPAQEK